MFPSVHALAYQHDQIVRGACRLGATLSLMHIPAAAAAGLPGSSGLCIMQNCRPTTLAESHLSASPICRRCGQQLPQPVRRQRQPQRKGRRITTALARSAPQPGKRASGAAAAAAAESGGLPNISAISHQTKVDDLISLQRNSGIRRLFRTQLTECVAITTSWFLSCCC